MELSKIIAHADRELSPAELVLVDIFAECMIAPCEDRLVRSTTGSSSWSLPDDSFYCSISFQLNPGFARCRGAELSVKSDGSLQLIGTDVWWYDSTNASDVAALKKRLTATIKARLQEPKEQADQFNGISQIKELAGRDLTPTEDVMLDLFIAAIKPWQSEFFQQEEGYPVWQGHDRYCRASFTSSDSRYSLFVRVGMVWIYAHANSTIMSIRVGETTEEFDSLPRSGREGFRSKLEKALKSELTESGESGASNGQPKPDAKTSLSPKADRRKRRREQTKRLREEARNR
jgi:hypothetical protein